MGENTKISWCDHSQNFWIGCTKISPGCANCYAKTQQEDLYHRVKWGKGEPRHITKTWKDPIKWNKKAVLAGVRAKVFTNSLADMFDEEVPDSWRHDAFAVIKACPNLDWLILTKRVQKAKDYLGKVPGWPWPNVWLGASVENQETHDERTAILKTIPAAIHFLSAEPLLASIKYDLENIQWVIVGGESGEGFRPMNPDWALSAWAQCQAVTPKISFFVKQGAGLINGSQMDIPDSLWNVKEWPAIKKA